MEVHVTLDTDFERQLERLKTEYGDAFFEIEGMDVKQLDTTQFFANYIGCSNTADASIDDNANVSSRNVAIMKNEALKPYFKLNSRSKIYHEIKEQFGKKDADKWLDLVINGALYEHDSMSSSFAPYCYAFSLKPIVEKGLFFIHGMKADPPQHWDTFNHHTLEFISFATNQLAGAVGIPDYLIYAYYFYQKDIKENPHMDTKRYRDQKFQEFVFNLNQPYLKASEQSAYSNVSILDTEHIVGFFGEDTYPDGSSIVYDHLEGVLQFQKDFMEYTNRLRRQKFFTFPVVSASLLFQDGKYVDEDMAKAVVEHNYSMGWNDINIYNAASVDGISSCCRLVSSQEELKKNLEDAHFNSIGGSSISIGSTKVVTINFARAGMEADGDIDKLCTIIRDRVDVIHKYHYAHRLCLKKLIDANLMPLYSYGLMSMDNQFATVGINGVFEGIRAMGGIETGPSGYRYSDKGIEIAKTALGTIVDANKVTTKKYGYTSNVEQIPGESASIKLLKKDELYFGYDHVHDIIGETKLYGNQWIPLNREADIMDRIEASTLDSACGGGVMLHVNLSENFKSFDDAWAFTNLLAKQGVVYFSYISKVSYCKQDHSFFGDRCPICGGEVEGHYIKIVGYIVKQSAYKKERQTEMDERVFYSV